MTSRLLSVCACLSLLVGRAAADVSFAGANVHFAASAEGRKLLTARDDFIRRLSEFDRSARMKVERRVTEDEFLEFVGRSTVAWSDDETSAIQRVLAAIQPAIARMRLSLPPTIQFVKTTGAEEGNAAYTRGSAIILPRKELGKSAQELEKVICHELFHVVSRHNPELQEKLYGIIGFTKCDEVQLPPALASRKITNPDAPRNDHVIRVQVDGQTESAVPILLAKTERYDAKRGGEFFDYLQLKLLVLPHDRSPQVGESTRLVDIAEVSGFMEQVGRNTSYIIHPEEILAENFALLVSKGEARSPEILQKMGAVLSD